MQSIFNAYLSSKDQVWSPVAFYSRTFLALPPKESDFIIEINAAKYINAKMDLGIMKSRSLKQNSPDTGIA